MLGGGVASIEEDEVEDEVQELGHAETYNDYMPVKCKYLSEVETRMIKLMFSSWIILSFWYENLNICNAHCHLHIFDIKYFT